MNADDIEIRALQRAYDELKCLDPEGRRRALTWLSAKFVAEEDEGRKARDRAQRERIEKMKKPRRARTSSENAT